MRNADEGKGRGKLGVGVQVAMKDSAQWKDRWTFRKYASQEDYEAGNPFEVDVVEQGNLLLNTGINEMWDLIAGDSANHLEVVVSDLTETSFSGEKLHRMLGAIAPK